MTDCFIMIHVIIFFVGVTDTLSGNRCVWFGLSVLVSKEVQRGNLCSVGVCRVGLCFLNHCVQFPLGFFWGGMLLSVRGTAEPDPAAKLSQL